MCRLSVQYGTKEGILCGNTEDTQVVLWGTVKDVVTKGMRDDHE